MFTSAAAAGLRATGGGPRWGRAAEGRVRAGHGRRAPDRAAADGRCRRATACSTWPAAPAASRATSRMRSGRRAGRRARRVGDDAAPRGRRDATPGSTSVAYVRGDVVDMPFRDAVVRRRLLLRGAQPVRRPDGGARLDDAACSRPAAGSRSSPRAATRSAPLRAFEDVVRRAQRHAHVRAARAGRRARGSAATPRSGSGSPASPSSWAAGWRADEESPIAPCGIRHPR